ncbi:hypothetical protein L1987_05905 [Smallanthus sonchifolius]|uniref:Uncharacterized protein n=1 Tax=Smallanthus sonchifolius TaxID=185202 RepID=A0ACB9JWN3_9ASTR|nr:hypothetical protein L1987_05905 [Smallanthus sonchifolius]
MMNISPKKLLIIRFVINPISVKTPNPNSLISSINTSIYNPNHAFYTHRCFSIGPDYNQNIGFVNTRAPKLRPTDTRNPKPYVSPKLISQLIDMVRISKGECRSKLDLMDITLSKASICEIIRVLSFEKVPTLRFFEWVRDNNPDLYRNADVCSLMVDNCGWLNNYDTMRALFKQFKHEQICLNDKAFAFLPVLDSSKARAMESISLVIRVLGEIGGSVHSSGVYALISMLCVTDSFELAKYVMEVTEKKSSYYAILVREKCRRGCVEEAYGLIKQMRAEDCEPDSKIYNYVLSSLCKVDKVTEALGLLEEMEEAGVDPDEITFEIFISYACRLGRMEFANESFDRLVHTGRRPRVSTYAAIVKGYFNAGRYEEAYAYVRDIEVKRMSVVHKMFSLLTGLHQNKGDIDAARRILDEMTEKGLKPDFLYYAKIVNVLRRVGGKDLARDLKNKFDKFRVEKEC